MPQGPSKRGRRRLSPAQDELKRNLRELASLKEARKETGSMAGRVNIKRAQQAVDRAGKRVLAAKGRKFPVSASGTAKNVAKRVVRAGHRKIRKKK